MKIIVKIEMEISACVQYLFFVSLTITVLNYAKRKIILEQMVLSRTSFSDSSDNYFLFYHCCI